MKKVMIILISAAVLLLLSKWILKGKVLNPLFRSFPEEYLLAVFDTTANANQTILTYYDSDFKPIYKQLLTMGSINGLAEFPIQSGNKVYMAPTGIWKKNDINSIVELDRITGKSHIYDVGQTGIWNLAADDQYLFFTSADPHAAGISLNRIEKKTEQLESLEFRKEEIDRIDIYGKMVYVFTHSEYKSYCYLYNANTFEREKTLDLTSYGRNPADTCLVSDMLYIVLGTDQYDNPVRTLLCLNISTNEMKKIELPENNPIQMEYYQGYLLISHEKREYSEYGSLTIYNIADEKGSNCELQSVPGQIQVMKNELYILDDAFDEMGVYSLDCEHGKVKLVKKHKLESKDSQLRSYYMPGFF